MSLGPSPRTNLPALSYTTAVTDTTSTSTSSRKGGGVGAADGAGPRASALPAQTRAARTAAAREAWITWRAGRGAWGPDVAPGGAGPGRPRARTARPR